MVEPGKGKGIGSPRPADHSIPGRNSTFKPYREGAPRLEYAYGLNLQDDRVVVREWRDEQNGALSDFMLAQQAFDHETGEWRDVAIIDAKHGSVHIHKYRRSGAELSRRDIGHYSTREEMEEIYGRVEKLLRDIWEENRRRWTSGR